MKRVIHKYEIPIEQEFTIRTTKFACLLSIQIDEKTNKPCMWFLEDSEGEKVDFKYKIIGTGQLTDLNAYEYAGTFQIEKGGLILHVFSPE